jgi:hypothetical protein
MMVVLWFQIWIYLIVALFMIKDTFLVGHGRKDYRLITSSSAACRINDIGIPLL